MNQSKHLEWVSETDVKTSMSPEAESRAQTHAHLPNEEHYKFGDKHSKLAGVAVSGINTSESPEAIALSKGSAKEGFTMTAPYTGSGYNNFKVNVTDVKIDTPIMAGYIPSLGETQIKDIEAIIERENTTFVLTTIAGVSVMVIGYMLLSNANSQ